MFILLFLPDWEMSPSYLNDHPFYFNIPQNVTNHLRRSLYQSHAFFSIFHIKCHVWPVIPCFIPSVTPLSTTIQSSVPSTTCGPILKVGGDGFHVLSFKLKGIMVLALPPSHLILSCSRRKGPTSPNSQPLLSYMSNEMMVSLVIWYFKMQRVTCHCNYLQRPRIFIVGPV